MSKAEKLLEKMRTNPRDWRIEDLEAIALRVGLTIRKPSGSHVIFQKEGIPFSVSVPAHKPIYIQRFIELLDA